MQLFNTGIYQIVNKVNGKRYIGSAVSLYGRKKDHISRLNRRNHYNKHLQRSYNKYGKENFKFEIIMHCSKEHLIFFEQKHIDKYDFEKELYNIYPTAGSSLGVKHSNETKEKWSIAKKGKKRNPDHVKKIADSQRGQKRQKVSREKNPSYKNVNVEKIKKLHKEGKTNKEISKILNISMRIIQTRMKWLNIESNRCNKKTEIDIEEIHKLRMSGLYYYQIAETFNVSEPVVSRNYRNSKYYKGKKYGKRKK